MNLTTTLPPVHCFRRQLRSFTWVALFAIFGFALAPTVSHALAGSSGGSNPWAEICSAAGAKVSVAAAATVAEGGQPPAQTGGVHIDHCPLCGGAVLGPALLPGAIAVLPVPDGAGLIPALFAHAPRPLFAWAAAQPRGPPSAA